MSVVCIVQARMGSSRLPGKVLMPLAGSPALWHVVTRVSMCKRIDKVVVATTIKERDQPIVDLCEENKWLCFRGDEQDVLSRYFHAAVEHNATQVVRVTSDCPLIDPDILDLLVREFWRQSVDYISTNYPVRRYPVGYDCEMMSMGKLTEINSSAVNDYDREHVTSYFYNNPLKYSLGSLTTESDKSGIRVTLDTAKDYQFLSQLFNACFERGRLIDMERIQEFLVEKRE